MDYKDFEFDYKPFSNFKKKILIMFLIFVFLLIITIIFLFLPFKDKTTFELIIEVYQKNDWNSLTVTKTVGSIVTWFFMVFKIIGSIGNGWILLQRKKALDLDLRRRGINISYETKKAKKIEKQGGIDAFYQQLLNILQELNIAPAIITHLIISTKEINELQIKSKEKQDKIKQLFFENGINFQDFALQKWISKI